MNFFPFIQKHFLQFLKRKELKALKGLFKEQKKIKRKNESFRNGRYVILKNEANAKKCLQNKIFQSKQLF